jgi:hypothetical protein
MSFFQGLYVFQKGTFIRYRSISFTSVPAVASVGANSTGFTSTTPLSNVEQEGRYHVYIGTMVLSFIAVVAEFRCISRMNRGKTEVGPGGGEIEGHRACVRCLVGDS